MGSIFSLKYQYQSLPDTRSIRLVKLCEQRFSPSIVECTIDIVSLNLCPPFTALSYTWGNPIGWNGIDATYDPKRGQIHFILLNRRPTLVTENLYQALCQIRASSRHDCCLWIDALCINQKDVDERSAQVRLMCDIYSSAETVLVWLGEEDAGSDFVHWIDKEFLPSLDKLIEEEGYAKVTAHRLGDPILWRKLKLAPIYGHKWKPLIDFFERSWFQRAWVIQELALAQNTHVLCGTKEFSHRLLDTLCLYFVGGPWGSGIKLQMDGIQALSGFLPGKGLSRITVQRWVVANGGPNFSTMVSLLHGVCDAYDHHMRILCFFDKLLFDIRGCAATDPRDSVYSVLGMVQRFNRDSCSLVQIDYSAPVSKVYTDTASLLLQNSPTLAHLSQVNDRAQCNTPNLPSWVPDYTIPMLPSFAWNWEGDRSVYDVDLQRAKSVRISWTERPILHLDGISWDVIAELGEDMTLILESKRLIECTSICLGIEGTYINNQSLAEAFWRCLVADVAIEKDGVNVSPAPEKWEAVFRVYMLSSCVSVIRSAERELEGTTLNEFKETVDSVQEQISPRVDPRSLFPTWSEIMEFKESFEEGQRRSEEYWTSDIESTRPVPSEPDKETSNRMINFERMVTRAVDGRRLFRTKRNLLGICPYSSAVGDSVWFLAGAKVPFILRPVADTEYHELLGECYLHGFMHGEINQFEKLDFQEISII